MLTLPVPTDPRTKRVRLLTRLHDKQPVVQYDNPRPLLVPDYEAAPPVPITTIRFNPHLYLLVTPHALTPIPKPQNTPEDLLILTTLHPDRLSTHNNTITHNGKTYQFPTPPDFTLYAATPLPDGLTAAALYTNPAPNQPTKALVVVFDLD